MTIDSIKEKDKLLLKLTGRLDTTTAPELEEALGSLEGVRHLQLDFAGLEYLSSAGLRVLLSASKRMKKQGEMEICNVNDEIMEVFTITGFSDILTIR